MTDSAMLLLAVISNVCISVGYAALGVLLASKFDAAAPTWALSTFKVSGLAFFLLCAATHGHNAWHIWTGQPDDPLSWHYALIHVPQAVAAIVASVTGCSFISLRVYDRRYYKGLLDREIDREAARLAATLRASDVEMVAADARRVARATDLIGAYMQGKAGR